MNRSLFRVCLLVGALALLAIIAPSAHAQYGFGYSGYRGWGGNGGFGWGRFGYGANAQTIPYFALHPPVYYSYPVARPYGFSPFATPPGMIPAEMRVMPQSKPEEIINPYVEPKTDEAPQPPAENGEPQTTSNRDRTARRVITNPYLPVSH